jgi:hypothetical protein
MNSNDAEAQAHTIIRVHRSLTNITPDLNQVARIERIRVEAKALVVAIVASTPPGREQSLALTHLEETVMWAVKAVVMETPSALIESLPVMANEAVAAEIKPDNGVIGVRSQ